MRAHDWRTGRQTIAANSTTMSATHSNDELRCIARTQSGPAAEKAVEILDARGVEVSADA